MRDDLAGGGRLLKICFAMLTNFAKAAGKYVSVRKTSVSQLKLRLNFGLRACRPSSCAHGRTAHALPIVLSSSVFFLMVRILEMNDVFKLSGLYLFCSNAFHCDTDIKRMP